MSRMIWIMGFAAFAVWTLVSVGGYAIISIVGDAMIRGSGSVSDPDVGRWLGWTFDFVQDFGAAMLIALWLAVSAVILGTTAFLGRLTGGRRGYRY